MKINSVISTHKIKTMMSKGIALVEVIAAMGIAVVVITSLVSLSLFTLRSSLASKLQLQGTKMATRESELIRAYRDFSDRTWESFLTDVQSCTGTAICCIALNASSIYKGSATSCQEGTGTELVTRTFTVTNLGGGSIDPSTDNVARFKIKASWTVGGQVKSTYLYTDLTNWRRME